ncbi:8116_t:CDS:2 [Cetraspora pellucida]|uniref:8116_t:CDS:1 n=1 Tax=Cetraspora pellucida TaxID=1433469 RepID=A0A9N9A9T7_9GLOM|nr:8116_t:CDS:2 [Cetraspora pellucida]
MFDLLQNEEFYSKCHQIASILKLVKELTNILEARNTDLAECFIGLTRLVTNMKNNQLQELALFLFLIVPSQEVCERNFSTLKWLFGDKYKELRVYSKDANDKDLKENLNNFVIMQPTEDSEIEDNNDNNSQQMLTNNLNLSQIIDLTLPKFLSTNITLFESAINRLSSHKKAYNLECREYDLI